MMALCLKVFSQWMSQNKQMENGYLDNLFIFWIKLQRIFGPISYSYFQSWYFLFEFSLHFQKKRCLSFDFVIKVLQRYFNISIILYSRHWLQPNPWRSSHGFFFCFFILSFYHWCEGKAKNPRMFLVCFVVFIFIYFLFFFKY